jgi:hypothetical protein
MKSPQRATTFSKYTTRSYTTQPPHIRASIPPSHGKTNLENKSLASADRSNKATLLLTALCSIFKSSAKDLSPPKSNIIFRWLKAKRFRLP